MTECLVITVAAVTTDTSDGPLVLCSSDNK